MDEDFEGPEPYWDDAEEFEKDQLARDADLDRAEEEHQRRLAEETEDDPGILPSEVDWF